MVFILSVSPETTLILYDLARYQNKMFQLNLYLYRSCLYFALNLCLCQDEWNVVSLSPSQELFLVLVCWQPPDMASFGDSNTQ